MQTSESAFGLKVYLKDGEKEWYNPIESGQITITDKEVTINHVLPHSYKHDFKDVLKMEMYDLDSDDTIITFNIIEPKESVV